MMKFDLESIMSELLLEYFYHVDTAKERDLSFNIGRLSLYVYYSLRWSELVKEAIDVMAECIISTPSELRRLADKYEKSIDPFALGFFDGYIRYIHLIIQMPFFMN